MRKFILFAALAAVIVSGCSQSEENTAGVTEANAIDFRPVIEKSRASVVGDVKELTSFFVQAKRGSDNNFDFLKAAVYREGGSWVYSPKKYYPIDGSVVKFYAYAPIKDFNMTGDLTFDNGEAVFGYEVPADQSGINPATDLLVADVAEGSKTTATAINLDFNHALSAVTFSASNSYEELTFVINAIKISNLYNEGTYTYGTPTPGTWDTTGDLKTYVAGIPASGVAVAPDAEAVKLLSANDVMMVLPQVVDATTVVEVTFSVRDGSGQIIYANHPSKIKIPSAVAGELFEFVQGTRYNFSFKFDNSNSNPGDPDPDNPSFIELNEIILNVTNLAEWTNENHPLN